MKTTFGEKEMFVMNVAIIPVLIIFGVYICIKKINKKCKYQVKFWKIKLKYLINKF